MDNFYSLSIVLLHGSNPGLKMPQMHVLDHSADHLNWQKLDQGYPPVQAIGAETLHEL